MVSPLSDEFPELLVAGSWEIQSKYIWPLDLFWGSTGSLRIDKPLVWCFNPQIENTGIKTGPNTRLFLFSLLQNSAFFI